MTFAPEAGTQRLRDVINKNVTEEEIERTCKIAFEGGSSSVKLYFMIGLPTKTDEDIKGIADTAQKIVDIYYSLPNKPKGRGVTVTISLATFVPKPFTPFQWEKQISLEEINRKQQYLKSLIKSKKIKLNYHDGKTSVIEGVFSRGDRRLGKVLLRAHEKGSMLEAWDEHFSYDRWLECLFGRRSYYRGIHREKKYRKSPSVGNNKYRNKPKIPSKRKKKHIRRKNHSIL